MSEQRPGDVLRVDLCVLGAGPAGFAAAMRSHDFGRKVALVERAKVGGAGLHAGALSSKTMWHLSNDFAVAARADRGYCAVTLDVSYPSVVETIQRAVEERHEQLTRQLSVLAREDERGSSVTTVRGAARFSSPHRVEVEGEDGRVRAIEAESFVIATGSRPRAPQGIEVDGARVITSDHVESLPAFPKSLVIVGAGVIGCEYATMFANFGRTEVFIIDRQPRILPFEDEDVAEVVAKQLEAKGVTIHRESKLESLRAVGDHVEYVLEDRAGARTTHRVERALVATGRVPNTDGIGLEAAGVVVDERGGIVARETRTSQPHIYAVGDVTADVALVNVAELEARYAVERMEGEAPPPIHYDAMSAIMFLSPEVASCGINELTARKQGIPYRVATVHNRLIGRNIAMRSTTGLVKLLAAKGTNRILGLRVVGPQASSTIQGIAFLIDRGGSVEDIERCVHPHPAIPEGVQECARLLLGRSVLKPGVFGSEGLLRCAEG